MKYKWLLIVLLLPLLVGGGLYWRFTRGNAYWQIRQVFPEAEVFKRREPGDEKLRTSNVIRKFFPDYYQLDERVGFAFTDFPEPLDLQERFARLSRLRISSVNLARCRVIRLCPVTEPGFPSYIVFKDCDFSALPPEQRARLDSTNRNAANTGFYLIGEMPEF